MNQARRILVFTVLTFTVLIIFSFMPETFEFSGINIKNVNLLRDLKQVSSKLSDPELSGNRELLDSSTAASSGFAFETYRQPSRIIDFSLKDSLRPGLPVLSTKLAEILKGKKRKVRIAFIGDSMIEGDLVSGDLRKILQQYFGGAGIGFMPVTSIVAGARSTAMQSFGDGWTDYNFRNAGKEKVFLSGHAFKSSGSAWFSIEDKTISAPVPVYLLYGEGKGNVTVNDNSMSIEGANPFNVQQLTTSPKVNINASAENLPLFGLSFESDEGVIVDNFSFRGVSGVELKRLDSVLLSAVNQERPYDLIILEYGLNVLDDNRDAHFGWYVKQFSESIKKIQASFPASDILLLSSGDRAFRVAGTYQTMQTVPNLVDAQAIIAFNNKVSFFNLYQSMGGENSMVDWVTGKPPLAYKDYMHPNEAGSAKIAGFIADAIMAEVRKVHLK